MSDQYHEAIGRAMKAFSRLIAPFVVRELEAAFGGRWDERVRLSRDEVLRSDTSVLIRLMKKHWREVFNQSLGADCRQSVDTIGKARNSWAHEEDFTKETALDAIDCSLHVLARAGVQDTGALELSRAEQN